MRFHTVRWQLNIFFRLELMLYLILVSRDTHTILGLETQYII